MPEKDKRRVIHLFKDDWVDFQLTGQARFRVNTYIGPYSVKTLCGEPALRLYVYSEKEDALLKAMAILPIKPDHERLCKRCLRSKDAGLRLLRIT